MRLGRVVWLFLSTLLLSAHGQMRKPEHFASGVVLDSSHQPVAGVGVALVQRLPKRPLATASFTVTDSNGRFKLPSPPVNIKAYQLAVAAVGKDGSSAVADIYGDDDSQLVLPKVSSVRLTLHRPDGRPLSGTNVFFGWLATVAPQFRHILTKKTDENGVCVLTTGSESQHWVDVSDDRYQFVDGLVRFPPAGAVVDELLTLQPSTGFSGRVVRKLDGTPIPNLPVEAQMETNGVPPVMDVKTNRRGEFHFNKVIPYSYRLSISDQGYMFGKLNPKARISVSVGKQVRMPDIFVSLPAHLKCFVVNAKTGQLASNVPITIKRRSGFSECWSTDAAGSITDDLEPDEYQIFVGNVDPPLAGITGPSVRTIILKEGETAVLHLLTDGNG